MTARTIFPKNTAGLGCKPAVGKVINVSYSAFNLDHHKKPE